MQTLQRRLLQRARLSGASSGARNIVTRSLRLCGARVLRGVRESDRWCELDSARPRQASSQGSRAACLAPDSPPEELPPQANQVHCDICNFNVNKSGWTRHAALPSHQRKERFAAYKTAFDEAEKDKHGVTVSNPGGLDYEVVALDDARRGVDKDLIVTTSVPASRVVLSECKVTSSTLSRNGPSSFVANFQASARDVRFGRELVVTVTLKQTYMGLYDARVELIFEDTALNARFAIVRNVRATIGDQNLHRQFAPVAPFVPRKRTARDPENNVVPGIRAPALGVIPWVIRLPESPIPSALSAILERGTVSHIVTRLQQTVMPGTFEASTYGRHFKNLLWVEEHRSELDLQIYDLPDATLNGYEPYHYLEVPGLAEKRPSVLVGDRILVQAHGSTLGKWFEGGVHVVRQSEVGLRFSGSFKAQHRPSQLYKVHFKLNRFPTRRQHQAMDTAFTEPRILFPAQRHVLTGRPRPEDVRLQLYNRSIGTNPPQLQAVTSIARLPPGAMPFCVFGPPGTGKTVTIVEAIRQIISRNPAARILAIAPSNSAADLIALRLTVLGADALLRLYAPSRYKNQVPDELLDTFTYSKDGHFSVPLMARLKQFKVVVSTAVSGSIPYGIGMPRGHFSHIFIDEAGQASEPEVMIAIKTMADSKTNVILSGDPKQLGPIIRSAVARRLGLELSYLERLMGTDLYDEQTGYGITVVKLVQNFRSHRSILKFPNERFYRGDLQECGDRKVIDAYLNWSGLPARRFPIIFHAMEGADTREASSPSFFNIHEIAQVKTYVQQLRDDRAIRITHNDIGVIAPYHAQCAKIRAALRPVAEGVKVGSVEEFQGQERKVIIISTVRSSREFVEYDLKHTLGFVANPRRFNVAVTRAQALLIIVGDPSVLSLDPLWRSFLNYIYINGGWTGPANMSWDPSAPVREDGGYDEELRQAGLNDMNEFARRMEG